MVSRLSKVADMEEHAPRTWVRTLQLYLLIQVLIFGAVGLIGLIAGWRTVNEYANALFIVGSVIIVLGVTRVAGLAAADRDFKSRYAHTISSEGSAAGVKRLARESLASFGTSGRMFLIGIVPIIVSIVVPLALR
jgi:hypothetical protein